MPNFFFSGLNVVTPPAADPITVQEARLHSRVFQTAEDALIAGYISSATRDCEDRTLRAFMPQTWSMTLNHWPGRLPSTGYYLDNNWQNRTKYDYIDIPKPPLQSIVQFTYVDTNGNVYYMQQGFSTTVGNYLLDITSEPGRVNLPFSGIWPTTILLPTSPITITFSCGYPTGQIGSPPVNNLLGFTGNVDIDGYGIATLVAGTPFIPLLAGQWITITATQTQTNTDPPNIQVQTGACNIARVIDSTHLQLITGTPSPISFPITNGIVGGTTTICSFQTNTVPQPIRNAILLLAAHRYDNREPIITGRSQTAIEIPMTIDSLLAPYVIYRT